MLIAGGGDAAGMRLVVSLATNLSEHSSAYLRFGHLGLLGASFARLGPVEEAPHFHELTAITDADRLLCEQIAATRPPLGTIS